MERYCSVEAPSLRFLHVLHAVDNQRVLRCGRTGVVERGASRLSCILEL